ncbi:restriction endonuclease subunit S [Leptospira kirschneri]|uniref:restriction endonuclease subunit S n=1 Tax=Leptospira kirschneri TaxID=29507 RepID=UPI0002E82F7C|nr:restriction endonuclease subunit S [Leptospira kirschneri]KON75907.1 Type I restriction modification DNA specificity domain protein [Leptospira kirschneri serovar Mozdok]KPZ75284.1 type I restriction endonuclease subunit S [Leptospira kirschneri serovar Mozdok]NDK06293.1 Type I restriction modification DNA specificity domain protein [Leptospira kirschneri serovar Mozdok]
MKAATQKLLNHASTLFYNETYSLQKGWVLTSIGELSKIIQYGFTESSSPEPIGPKFLRITDIQDNKVDWPSVPYCGINENEKVKYALSEGDLLFARTGATVGKSFLIKGIIPESIFASYLIRLRFSTEISNYFISYFFQSHFYWRQITEGQVGIGQPNVNGTKLAQLIIPLPPLAEQQRIVSKIEELFSELDKGVENLKTTQQQLKVYRQAVLKSAVEGKLTKDWRDQNPDQSVSEDIVEEEDSSLGELPDGWKWVALKAVLKNRITNGYSGKPVNYKTNQKVLKLSATTSGKFESAYFKYLDEDHLEKKDIWCSYDDILIQRGNTIEYVGVPTIFTGNDKEFIFPDLMFRVQCNKNIVIPKYIYYNLSNPFQRSFLRKRVTGSAGNMPKINQVILNATPICLPNISEQQIIVQEIESRLSVCDKLEETIQSSLNQAESLRQSILKKAFEGKLVAQDPKDEPASVLLERIRAEKESIFQKTNANSEKKTNKKQNPENGNLIQFPRLVPDISTTELHAGVIAMVIDAHEKQSKYLENLNHVKCEKISHLVESYIGISLGRNPVKDAAGPDDFPHLKLVESRALKANYFGIQKQIIGYTYISKRGLQKVIDKVSKVLNLDEQGRIRNLIEATLKMDKEQAEIFATLYAGWNNLLLEGKKPSDEEIVYESRENWSPEKLKLSRSRFFTALGWMRKKGYVPEGKGVIVSKSVKKTPTKKRKKTKV